MKKTAAIVIFLFAAIATFAQSDKTKDILSRDTILSKINKNLPAGWEMIIDDTSITVCRHEPYVFIEKDCSTISPDSLASLPRTETALLRFLYSEKWSNERVFWTRESNDSISIVVQSLPREMGITQLEDKEKSTRYLKVYTGKTKEEKEKVAAYYKRKNQLLVNFDPIPNFNTTLFSLKQRAQTGMQKPGQCVYPYDAYKEALSVYILFLEYCDNPLE